MEERTRKMTGRFQMDSVVVDFGVNRAIDHVTMDIQPGEIVGLLGHNGAGKSTILNLASGAIRWTAGSVRIDGQEIANGSTPRDFSQAGVAVIHQEPSLIHSLSVFDNMCLGHRFSASMTNGRKRELVSSALADLGIDVGIDSPAGTLTIGQRQMVDLARSTMSSSVRVLLLDEPTAALGAAETEELHALIRKFASEGTSVIYVSHRLPDILDICGRIIVLNTGRMIMDSPASSLSLQDLSNALAPGLKKTAKVAPEHIGAPVLDIRMAHGEVHAAKGEVIGLFGMASGEQFSLAADLFGLGSPQERDEASFTLADKEYAPANPVAAIRNGVFYVPPDRDVEGLIADFPAKTNILMPWYRKLGSSWHVSGNFGEDMYRQCREDLQIIGPDGKTPIGQFSGGNRQKHLLARWMMPAKADVLVMAQPTQGVDIGAKDDIVRAVRRKAGEGACILVASSETDEIVSMCDRAYVILGDRVLEYTGDDLNDENLLQGLLSLAHIRSGGKPASTPDSVSAGAVVNAASR
ncbi:MAG: sugar ABC transporter ATP-binding protein [Bifidobacterium tibiigranuli]|nr:sugar ABC transporter ATP-binding protein [Bifidobacterium tibiigranuli]